MITKTLIGGSAVFAICLGVGFVANAQTAPTLGSPSTTPGSLNRPTSPLPGSTNSTITPGTLRPNTTTTPPDVLAPNVPGSTTFPQTTSPTLPRTNTRGQINPPDRIYNPNIGSPTRRGTTSGSVSAPGSLTAPGSINTPGTISPRF